jgi:prefoldin alpha subunit
MMNKQDELQRKIIEFQILESNLKMLQERAEIFNGKMEELQRTKEAMEELKVTKPSKALIPLGSGNFVYGSVENCDDIIIGIGSGAAIKKKREDAMVNLDGRIKEIESELETLLKQVSMFVYQLEKTQQDIESLQK